MRIEVLYFDGCPSHEQLLVHLRSLLEREGIDAEIVLRHVPDDEHAQRERFLGSPTIRVDGRDIDPGAPDRDDYGLKCRIYQTRAGLTGLPPDHWILEAIAEHPGGTPMTARIELPELQRLIAEQAQLVEVLPPAEYAKAQLPGAINIPLEQLDRHSSADWTGAGQSLSTARTTPET